MLKSVIQQLPNVMSLFRLTLGLAFPWIPGEWQLTVVILAGLSDLFDGTLGRWTGSTSITGQMLDPIADKVFVLGTLITVVAEGLLSVADLILIGFRDIIVLAICLWVAVREDWSHFRRMKPLWTGKVATGGQFVYLVALLWCRSRVPSLFVIVVLVSISAGLHYAWAFTRELYWRRDDS